MKKLKGIKVSAIALAAAGVVGLIGVSGAAFAATSNSRQVQQDKLADRLATNLGVDKSKVQTELKAFHDEEEKSRDEQRKADLSSALQKKVDDGTITADQKTKLEAKLAEKEAANKAERDANDAAGTKPTRDEMKTKMDAEKTEMDAWLKEQGMNLSLADIMPARGGMHGGMGGRGHGDDMNGSDSTTQN
jgi:hypothetical protein